jgi:AFG3 family protein
MIHLLGKRPFVGRADDMDKWLDDNRGSERSAPEPLEGPVDAEPSPTPAPGIASARLEDRSI